MVKSRRAETVNHGEHGVILPLQPLDSLYRVVEVPGWDSVGCGKRRFTGLATGNG